MIGQPAAAPVRRSPRRIACVVRAQLVAQVDRPAHKPPHPVLAGADEMGVQVVGSLDGRRDARFVEPIPTDDVFAGFKKAFADEVAHAHTVSILDHQRHISWRIQRDVDRDRPLIERIELKGPHRLVRPNREAFRQRTLAMDIELLILGERAL